MVKPGHSFTGITEYRQHFSFGEATTQTFIHQLQHVDLDNISYFSNLEDPFVKLVTL